MNRRVWAWLLLLPLALIPLALSAAAFPVPGIFTQRFRGQAVRVRNIEGVRERVVDGKLHLRLKDFLTLMLANNTEINIARLDVMTSANAVLSAHAPFDPSLTAGFNTLRNVSPSFSQIQGASTLSSLGQNSQLGYTQTLSTGQSINLGFSAARTSNNSQFQYFNPSIFTGLNFSFTQPLLQNRTAIQFRAPLAIARTQLVIMSEQSETRIADLVANAARQYWDAVEVRENIRVAQQSLDLAQKSYERDRMALDLGALPRLDIFQSQSQVAQRKVAVIQAQYAYRDSLDVLRRLIGADLLPETRDAEIVLDDDPSNLPALAPLEPLNDVIAAALHDRPELSSARRRTSIDELNARVARNSMMTRLDLSGIGGASGLGGNQVPVSSPLNIGPSQFIPGGLGDALGQMFGFGAPFYGFALQLTFPIRSSAAEASLADALVSKARDEYQQRQLEQQVIQDVKLARNQLEMASNQIDAAKVARDLSQKNVEAEQQKYELGGVTAFEVLQAQSSLAAVESSLVNAYTSYQRALINYKRANWTLLDGLGMVVETPKVR
ncbi:MAG TPA: TolC family protein [Bryobacteraceae bacterium]|nr:TolC family protein [Bryobacteraceae bacterium]